MEAHFLHADKEGNLVVKEQIDKFAHTMHHPNNRPLQTANARAILK